MKAIIKVVKQWLLMPFTLYIILSCKHPNDVYEIMDNYLGVNRNAACRFVMKVLKNRTIIKKIITKLFGYLIITSIFPVVVIMASGFPFNQSIYPWHFPAWSISLTILILLITGTVLIITADLIDSDQRFN